MAYVLYVIHTDLPGIAIETISTLPFTDVDIDPFEVSGTLTFTRVPQDVTENYLGYRLFRAIGSRANDRIPPEIANITIASLGSDINSAFQLPNNTILDAGVVLQIVPFNYGGDSLFSKVVTVNDLGSPPLPSSHHDLVNELFLIMYPPKQHLQPRRLLWQRTSSSLTQTFSSGSCKVL